MNFFELEGFDIAECKGVRNWPSSGQLCLLTAPGPQQTEPFLITFGLS